MSGGSDSIDCSRDLMQSRLSLLLVEQRLDDWAQHILRRLDAKRLEHVSLHLAQPNHVAFQLEHIALQLKRVADSLPHDAIV